MDALLIVSFGGPEGPDDVLPFLENVTRGRGVPRERLTAVGGALHAVRRGLADQRPQPRPVAAVTAELRSRGEDLPVAVGQPELGPVHHRGPA